jgi:hypothetical protein
MFFVTFLIAVMRYMAVLSWTLNVVPFCLLHWSRYPQSLSLFYSFPPPLILFQRWDFNYMNLSFFSSSNSSLNIMLWFCFTLILWAWIKPSFFKAFHHSVVPLFSCGMTAESQGIMSLQFYQFLNFSSRGCSKPACFVSVPTVP